MKWLFYIVLIFLPVGVYCQNNLVIDGRAPMLKDGVQISIEQYVPKRFSGQYTPRKTVLRNHHFSIKMRLADATPCYFTVNKRHTLMFLSPGMVKINIADSTLTQDSVTPNLANSEYKNYNAQFDTISLIIAYGKARADYDACVRAQNADSSFVNFKLQKRDLLRDRLNKLFFTTCKTWINACPKSAINPYILYSQIGNTDEKPIKEIYDAMPPSLKKNIWGRELKYRMDSLSVGGKAPLFVQADTNGKLVMLKNLKGKYVLLDFWASWCLPCRAENPNIVKAMKKFKNKNFTVLSISLDKNREDWLKAIQKDQLNWTHLSDLNGSGNLVAIKYYLSSIPSNYLLDPHGVIIAMNLYGDDLLTTLGKIIN